MKHYLLQSSDDGSTSLLDRLSQLIPISSIDVDELAQHVRSGDVIFAPVDSLSGMSGAKLCDLFETHLIKGAHLLIHPPIPSSEFRWPWPEVQKISFQPVDYSSLTIVDKGLSEAVN